MLRLSARTFCRVKAGGMPVPWHKSASGTSIVEVEGGGKPAKVELYARVCSSDQRNDLGRRLAPFRVRSRAQSRSSDGGLRTTAYCRRSVGDVCARLHVVVRCDPQRQVSRLASHRTDVEQFTPLRLVPGRRCSSRSSGSRARRGSNFRPASRRGAARAGNTEAPPADRERMPPSARGRACANASRRAAASGHPP